LGVELLLEIHGAGHVGEEDGDVFAFAAGGDDRPRVGSSRSRRNRSSAFDAEEFRLGNRGPTGGTCPGEKRAARAAEPGAVPVLVPAGGADHWALFAEASTSIRRACPVAPTSRNRRWAVVSSRSQPAWSPSARLV